MTTPLALLPELHKKLKVPLRMVREKIGSALLKPRKMEQFRWSLAAAPSLRGQILQADGKAPETTAYCSAGSMNGSRSRCRIWGSTNGKYMHDWKVAKMGELAEGGRVPAKRWVRFTTCSHFLQKPRKVGGNARSTAQR